MDKGKRKQLHVGLVTGEASGDNLAAGLIQALAQYYDLTITGVVGPKVQALGGQSLFAMDTLSVMGFYEPVKRLPQLISIRTGLIKHFSANRPDVFIGVDSPDFNLGLELALKKQGIKTVHYVSPSVWAWRQGRIHKIKKAVDLMLTLFPFELDFYRQHAVNAVCVGHPMADQIALEVDVARAQAVLNVEKNKTIVAMLPGSRSSEVRYMAPVYLQTANWLQEQGETIQWLVPFVNDELKAQFDVIRQHVAPSLDIQYFYGHAREVMTVADSVLLTSGTATLEAMLLKKPMVVAYRMSWPTYQIAKMMIKTKYISLPNILCGQALVPEFIQHEVTPEHLGQALQRSLHQLAYVGQLKDQFLAAHKKLQSGASERAVVALLALLEPAL